MLSGDGFDWGFGRGRRLWRGGRLDNALGSFGGAVVLDDGNVLTAVHEVEANLVADAVVTPDFLNRHVVVFAKPPRDVHHPCGT